ncbi:MAG: TonB-dependent receptor, partial [Gammaproteobacteria bacterium]|nr:TonB-dependent receptor [Gammaproteobacteria bacterium]
ALPRITVNAGETLHKGIELGIDSALTDEVQLAVSVSYAEHTYEDWVHSGVDYSGNEIESAPRNIANTRLNYKPELLNGGRVEAEWVHMGKYWMDQSNTAKYDGHDFYNLRANYFVSTAFEVYARVMNVTDERYAEAASNGEYAPGMPRTVYGGVTYKF